MDTNNNVYVADQGFRIQKFDSNGTYVTRFYGPISLGAKYLAVDANDNVYVANAGNGTVYKYDSSGSFITSWSDVGSHGIAVAPNDCVYVSDFWDDKIRKFDLDGNFITEWPHDFSWSTECGLAVNSDGNVYAVKGKGVVKYDPNGALIVEWGSSGSGDGRFKDPQDVTVGPDGSVYLADTGNNRIQKFTSDGDFLAKWGTLNTLSQLRRPEGVTIGGDGTVFVADTLADQVQSFTSEGVFLTRWDTADYPSGISTDASSYVYVSGPGVPYSGSRTVYAGAIGIRRYTHDGSFLDKFGYCGSDDGQTDWPSGVAVGPDGNVYVADTSNERVQKLAPDGTFLAKWGTFGNGDGQFYSPEGVAVSADGSVYVVDTSGNHIQKFSLDGAFLAKWGTFGNGDGQFDHPKGIAVDSSGYVYVADALNDRIQKFTPDGVFVTQWGSYGQGDGQFDTPLGIVVDSSGYVYVADTRNNRIQKFEKASPNLSSSAKFVDKNVAQPGDILSYTIILNNTGSLAATEVVVTDTFPLWAIYNTGSLWASSGNYDESGGVITWEGTVNVRVPVTITFNVSINATVPKGTLIINSATINDDVNPPFVRTVTTTADPYQVYLPITLKG